MQLKTAFIATRKKAVKGKYRSFVHELGDPMMVSHMENSDLDVGFFNKISIDSLEVPVRVKAGVKEYGEIIAVLDLTCGL